MRESLSITRKLGCGLMAKPEIEGFTEKMKYAIDHLEELKEGAKRGRKYLLEKQNVNISAEKLETELFSVLIPRQSWFAL